MDKLVFIGILTRYIIASAGAILVTLGLTNEQVETFAGLAATVVVGGVTFVAPIVYGYFSRARAVEKAAESGVAK